MFGLAAAVLSVVLLAGCGGGGGGGDTDPGQPPPTDTFSGTVKFKGNPLPGVKVLLYTENENYFEQTTLTDANGNYSFPGLCTSADVPSEWLVWAMKDGYGFYPAVASGAQVVRCGCNNFLQGYNTGGVGLDVTGIQFTSLPNAPLAGADFAAFDGSTPLVALARTGQTTVYAPGDDASQAKGVPWPATRFVDNQDGTVTDQLTGLVWLKNAATFGNAIWPTALTEVAALASGANGLTDGSKAGDWRLPNLNELESLVDVSQSNPALPQGNPFTNVSNGIYWTSTGYTGFSWGAVYAWAIRLGDGSYINDLLSNVEATSTNGVWAVKGAGGGGAVQLQATGLWYTNTPGDDGSTQTGVHLTYPRWIDNGDGTTTDTVTGLVWLQQANAINLPWAEAVAAVNALQSGTHGLTDGSAAGNWRMPTRNEMQSLEDREQSDHACYFVNQFNYANGSLYQPAVFTGFVEGQYYWTSTTCAADPTQAWTVYSCDFGVYDMPKANSGYTLAVRARLN
jgi:hypothetical protein